MGLSCILTIIGVFCLDADITVLCAEGRTLLGGRHLFQHRTNISTVVIVPRSVADMLLNHHTIPFATGNLLVVLEVQQRVALEGLATTFCPTVGIGVAQRREFQVHGLGVVHLVDVAHGLNGEEDNLTISIAGLGFQGDELAQGSGLEGLILAHHLGKLVGGIDAGVEHLGGDTTIVLAHEVQNLRSLTGLFLAKALGAEVVGVVQEIIHFVFIGVPRHVHKQLDGVFHGLQVAHVQDPQLLDATVIGQLQLFPHVLYRGHVDPFRITGRSHIVHMVVESPAAFALLFLCRRQTAHVAPVIVAEQYRYIVGYAQSGIIVILYLFI